MNTLQLENILKDVTCFRGVYPADKLSSLVTKIWRKHKNEPSCFISNTQGSHEPGEHWVAFYISPPAENTRRHHRHLNVEFFDSFGFHNRHSFSHTEYFNNFIQQIKKEARKNTITLKMNVNRLQDRSSALCGYYCVVYVHFRCRNHRTMSAILNTLNATPAHARRPDYKQNDANVLKIFKRNMRNISETHIQQGGTHRNCRKQTIQKCVPMRQCSNR